MKRRDFSHTLYIVKFSAFAGKQQTNYLIQLKVINLSHFAFGNKRSTSVQIFKNSRRTEVECFQCIRIRVKLN